MLLEILEAPMGVASGRNRLQQPLVLLMLLAVCVKPLGQPLQLTDKLLLILSYEQNRNLSSLSSLLTVDIQHHMWKLFLGFVSAEVRKESLFPVLTFLRSGIGVERGGQEGTGTLGSQGCFSGSRDSRWDKSLVPSHSRSILQQVWLPVFSHSHCWGHYHFATHHSADRYLALAPGMFRLPRKTDIWFFL